MTVIGAITPAWSLTETNLLPPVFTFVTGNCKSCFLKKFGALFKKKNYVVFLNERCVYQKICKNYKRSFSIIHITESHFND